MGNDISKKDNLDTEFKQKSNLIIEELDAFFGPIEGFYFKSSDGRKTEIKSLDSKYTPEFSQDVIDKIKNERNVCNNIIGVYRNTLKGLLKNKLFSKRLDSFVRNKKLDTQKFDIGIRITNFKDEPAICDRVVEYYWMKYLVYRMLRNLDPLAEEYAMIDKLTKSKKWSNLFDKNYEEAIKIKKDLDQQRNKVRGLIHENIDKLLKDNLTYEDLMEIYKNLIEDKKLESYVEKIYNICENLADLETSTNPKAFKFTTRGKIKGVNLQNYKQVKLCKRLKSHSGVDFGRQLKSPNGPDPIQIGKPKDITKNLVISTKPGLPKLDRSQRSGTPTSTQLSKTQRVLERNPRLKSILKKARVENKPTTKSVRFDTQVSKGASKTKKKVGFQDDEDSE